MYANDNKDQLPPYHNTPTGDRDNVTPSKGVLEGWGRGLLEEYLNITGKVPVGYNSPPLSVSSLACPTRKSIPGSWVYSYGVNYHTAYLNCKIANLSQLKHPSQTIFFGETQLTNTTAFVALWGFAVPERIGGIHNGGSNLLFNDWHVEWRSLKEIPIQATDPRATAFWYFFE